MNTILKNLRLFDFLIIIFIIFSTSISFILLPESKGNCHCKIYLQGKLYAKYKLEKDIFICDTIKTKNGFIIYTINNESMRIINSSCPQKICMKKGAIKKPGQTIVCVPNKFLAVITKSNEQIDAISE